MFFMLHDTLNSINVSRFIMNFDLIGLLVLLRLIGLVMLITIVLVTNVFTAFGAFTTYFLNSILFLLLGALVIYDELKSNRATGIFGPFVAILGFAYLIGSIVNADGMARALGNGLTPVGLIFYGTSFLLAAIVHFVYKKYSSDQSAGSEDPPENNG
jgi:hypothetical protein